MVGLRTWNAEKNCLLRKNMMLEIILSKEHGVKGDVLAIIVTSFAVYDFIEIIHTPYVVEYTVVHHMVLQFTPYRLGCFNIFTFW